MNIPLYDNGRCVAHRFLQRQDAHRVYGELAAELGWPGIYKMCTSGTLWNVIVSAPTATAFLSQYQSIDKTEVRFSTFSNIGGRNALPIQPQSSPFQKKVKQAMVDTMNTIDMNRFIDLHQRNLHHIVDTTKFPSEPNNGISVDLAPTLQTYFERVFYPLVLGDILNDNQGSKAKAYLAFKKAQISAGRLLRKSQNEVYRPMGYSLPRFLQPLWRWFSYLVLQGPDQYFLHAPMKHYTKQGLLDRVRLAMGTEWNLDPKLVAHTGLIFPLAGKINAPVARALFELASNTQDYAARLNALRTESLFRPNKVLDLPEIHATHPYLCALVQEALRLQNVGATIDRVVTSPVTVPFRAGVNTPVANVSLNRGELVTIATYACHVNPSDWEQPTKFLPERHHQQDELKEPYGIAHPKSTLIAFGKYNRACPSIRFATTWTAMLLSDILHQFNVQLDRDSRFQEGFTITVNLEKAILRFSKLVA
ncbi:MAG: cytochrome P450 [Symploca sp. SIO2E6]|nr:cytochrome P450 [Symploca sp. SIO2E6]